MAVPHTYENFLTDMGTHTRDEELHSKQCTF